MPEMDGLVLLQKCKEIQPSASRIMISGHYTVDVVIRAINHGEVFRFLPKPCTLSELLETVRAGVNHHRIYSENQIEALQRRETLAMISGGIAHDINNSLAAVMGNITLIREEDKLSEFQQKRLDLLERSALQAGRLCQRLLKHYRAQAQDPKPQNFHELIADAVELSRSSLSRKIRVKTSLEATHHIVLIDETSAVQMLLNLIVNARDAMTEGGDLTIATENLVGEKSNEMLSCKVIDTGAGIPSALVPLIFSPYFSTKPKGQGTGLGLSIVKTAVARAAGEITVQSTVGAGTTFEILLPVLRTEQEDGD
jgi:signal transduction histidine kinase